MPSTSIRISAASEGRFLNRSTRISWAMEGMAGDLRMGEGRGATVVASGTVIAQLVVGEEMILARSERIGLLRSAQAHRPVSRAALRSSDVFFSLGARIHFAVLLRCNTV